MKKFLYVSIAFVFATTLIYSCDETQEAVFPSLQYSIDKIELWDTTKYFNLVFQYFSPAIEENASWQLICYGQYSTPGIISSSINNDTLPASENHDLTSVVGAVNLGNNIIRVKLLRAVAEYAKSFYKAKYLTFIPAKSDTFKNYIVYKVKIPNPKPSSESDKYLKIDTLRLLPEYRRFIKRDRDGDYVELNPCPPANMYISEPERNYK